MNWAQYKIWQVAKLLGLKKWAKRYRFSFFARKFPRYARRFPRSAAVLAERM